MSEDQAPIARHQFLCGYCGNTVQLLGTVEWVTKRHKEPLTCPHCQVTWSSPDGDPKIGHRCNMEPIGKLALITQEGLFEHLLTQS